MFERIALTLYFVSINIRVNVPFNVSECDARLMNESVRSRSNSREGVTNRPPGRTRQQATILVILSRLETKGSGSPVPHEGSLKGRRRCCKPEIARGEAASSDSRVKQFEIVCTRLAGIKVNAGWFWHWGIWDLGAKGSRVGISRKLEVFKSLRIRKNHRSLEGTVGMRIFERGIWNVNFVPKIWILTPRMKLMLDVGI